MNNVTTIDRNAQRLEDFVRECEQEQERIQESPAPLRNVQNQPNLPTGLSMGEQAAGILREFLDANGLTGWTCFFDEEFKLQGIDGYIKQLAESDSKWIPFGSFSCGGHQPACYLETQSDTKPTWYPAGFLWIRHCRVIIFRWFELSTGSWSPHVLFAAACVQDFERFCHDIQQLRRSSGRQLWHVWSDMPTRTKGLPRTSRIAWDDLVLAPALRRRLQTEVIDFFSDPAAALYRDLGIPYRRGVLLHGSPGNGKTSIIRALGALQPNVSAMLLRAGSRFHDNDFVGLIRDWSKQAPALLVIEDLDSILSTMKLSTFLNQIDGIDQTDGGLLLVATTNYPENLDPAINNRPGRFDVVVEVGPPTQPLRLQYLKKCSLQSLGDTLVEELSVATRGLSFAQLREIESLSGLIVLRAGRNCRTPDDVREAANIVLRSHTEAGRNFPGRKTRAGFIAEQVEE